MAVSEKSRWLILLVVSSALFLIVIDIARIGAGLEPAGRAFLGKPASRAWGWEAAGKQPPSLPR
jgi:hypothetical protein